MTCNAYMADITDPKHRTKRVAYMAGLHPIAFNVGKGLGAVVKENLGFTALFSLSLGIAVAGELYVVLCLPDSLPIRERRLKAMEKVAGGEEEDNPRNKELRFFFSLQNLIGSFRY